ncbi:myocardin-related transcription factor B isoform X2 [Boleophthalmus pectinirostris]|uniref:myocardin-related transcription factor B isoform X2 n=1 Tax=Boleophthalmus pectinirostris TaxID=150288 RepID=UPI002431F562|nr:myocardin-related transcription factor B isoform X2 [Boleophthalmus pectinirostris]
MEASRLGAEGDCGMSSLLVPSPQSEAMTHEMEELSLQPLQTLPPLNERKNVLQLRLQQRRTREQLVDQGIMPPLKSPAAFHGQIRSLERARTENFLKHKIRSRPERAELVRMHILQETGAEPSLQATQMKLKRARLADNLNEKIAQRPGPMELVEKNILPVDSTLKQAIIVGQVNYPKVLDEDSRPPETPSVVQTAPQLPTTILQAVPVSTPTTTDFIKVLSTNEQAPPAVTQSPPATITLPTKQGFTLIKQSQQKTGSDKSRNKKSKEPKSRVKKLKYHQYVPPDQKQESAEAHMDSSYARLLQQQQLFLQLQILSQQQQHYNYQTILPAPLKPVAEGQGASTNSLPTSIVVSLPTAPPPPPLPPARPVNMLTNRRPGVLPANLEEMKVAELKMELKLRGLPVSGTKTDLIERLKPFQDSPAPVPAPALASVPSTTALTAVPMEIATTATTTSAAPTIILPAQQASPNDPTMPTPPVSPIPQDVGMPDAPAETPQPPRVPEEKDRRLHEKERQIEELMRKLEQEQKLVEELKMQLEVEKKGGMSSDPSVKQEANNIFSNCTTVPNSIVNTSQITSNAIKNEGAISPNCLSTASSSILGSQITAPLPTMVKLEDVTVSSGKPLQIQSQLVTQRSPKLQNRPLNQQATPGLQQFFISHSGGVSQVLGQPQTLLTAAGQAGAQILVPVSLPNNAIQLPTTTVSLQPVQLQAAVSNPAPARVQTSVPQLQSAKMDATPTPLLQTLTMCNNNSGLESQTRADLSPQCFLRTSPDPRVSPRASPNHHISNGPLSKSPVQSSSPGQPTFILQPAPLLPPPPKSREPPRYEDAVKQSRNLLTNHCSQVSTATSQQMDDLFDILIESGEIAPFTQQETPMPVNKALPVTAHISTLPVNTVLSRPPPQVQLAPAPGLATLGDPSLSSLRGPSPLSLSSEQQLEALLEGTLSDSSPADPRTQGLMEELQAQLMEQQPFSPMDTSELSFSSSPPSSLHMGLSDPALDNMEWLDLTMPPGPGPLTPLTIPSDFLDSHDLQLHWD